MPFGKHDDGGFAHDGRSRQHHQQDDEIKTMDDTLLVQHDTNFYLLSL
jgi:hypothetical protein